MIHCFNQYYSGLHPVFVEDAKSGSGMCSPVSKSKVEQTFMEDPLRKTRENPCVHWLVVGSIPSPCILTVNHIELETSHLWKGTKTTTSEPNIFHLLIYSLLFS